MRPTCGMRDYRLERVGKQQATTMQSTGVLFFPEAEIKDTCHKVKKKKADFSLLYYLDMQ